MKRLSHVILGLALALGLGSATANPPWLFVNASNPLVFQNVFTSGTLVSQIGPRLSITRATASTTTDHEGLVRPILSGEARFWKLRRVENLLAFPEAFSNAAWEKIAGGTGTVPTITDAYGSTAAPDGTFTATRMQFARGASNTGSDYSITRQSITGVTGWYSAGSVYLRSTGGGAVNLFLRDSSANPNTLVTLALDGTWRRFTLGALTTSGTGHYLEVGTGLASSADASPDVLVWHPQQENVTGQAIQRPSEYVSKGILSTPYHGAGVDGVKYFNTANGNTVASNVVTEVAGAALTVTAAGLSVFEAATNIILQSEDHGTTWTAIAATSPTRSAASASVGAVVLDLLGDDSGVLAEGYTQTVTFTGNAVKSISVFVKKGTATSSAIRLRDNIGVANRLLAAITWTGSVPTVTMTTGTLEGTEALAGNVYRINLATTSVTAANTHTLEIYPATDAGLAGGATGDILVGGWMGRNATASAPYVKTTTASVAVNADVVTASGAGIINQLEGTLFAQVVGPVNGAGNHVFLSVDDGTTSELVYLSQSGSQVQVVVNDGGVNQATVNLSNITSGVSSRLAGRYRLNDVNFARDGTAGTADTSGTMPTTTTIRLDYPTASLAAADTVIQDVRVYNAGFADTPLAALQ